jgi:hypothetical protein
MGAQAQSKNETTIRNILNEQTRAGIREISMAL